MEDNQNKKYLGTVSLSDEELEDMSLDISYSEGTRLTVSYTHLRAHET